MSRMFIRIMSLAALLLCSCSSINSVQPFDDQQARILVKNIYGIKAPNSVDKQ